MATMTAQGPLLQQRAATAAAACRPPCAAAALRRRRHGACSHRSRSTTTAASTPQQREASSLDVSGAVVSPSFRSTPWAAEAAQAASGDGRAAASVCFVSESGVCRCVLAAAAFERALAARGLAGAVDIQCRATRDYCLGQGPDPAAAAVAAELGLALPAGYAVRQFKEAVDIVDFDVLLVPDKFTAADVLREVSVFDTIKTWGLGPVSYSSKVRRLGEFAPAPAAGAVAGAAGKADPEAGDIGDPLYGNVGGEAELAAVRAAAADVVAACEGLADFVADVATKHAAAQAQAASSGAAGSSTAGSAADGGAASAEAGADSGSARLGDMLLAAVRDMEALEWLVPPMLLPR